MDAHLHKKKWDAASTCVQERAVGAELDGRIAHTHAHTTVSMSVTAHSACSYPTSARFVAHIRSLYKAQQPACPARRRHQGHHSSGGHSPRRYNAFGLGTTLRAIHLKRTPPPPPPLISPPGHPVHHTSEWKTGYRPSAALQNLEREKAEEG